MHDRWEEDASRERREERWYRQADNTPIMSGQFWALWDHHIEDYQRLYKKVEDIEERLLEERAKNFGMTLISTFTGRIIIVVIAIAAAYFATSYGLPMIP